MDARAVDQKAGDRRAGYAVFDLDGVLADVRHRLRHVAGRPKRWAQFFAEAPADPLLAPGAAAVAREAAAGRRVAYLTGRPERCRTDTVAWLARHGLPAGPLVMRGNTDRRPARQTKAEALRRWPGRVDVVYDDDAAVVAALRAAGFAVVHATWMDGGGDGVDGSPAAVLQEVQEDEGRT